MTQKKHDPQRAQLFVDSWGLDGAAPRAVGVQQPLLFVGNRSQSAQLELWSDGALIITLEAAKMDPAAKTVSFLHPHSHAVVGAAAYAEAAKPRLAAPDGSVPVSVAVRRCSGELVTILAAVAATSVEGWAAAVAQVADQLRAAEGAGAAPPGLCPDRVYYEDKHCRVYGDRYVFFGFPAVRPPPTPLSRLVIAWYFFPFGWTKPSSSVRLKTLRCPRT